jgi:hypothetical protein
MSTPATEGNGMERRYYDADSLARVLAAMEDTYGMSSDEFYEAYLTGAPIDGLSRFNRHVWASFYRDVQRLRHDGFAENAKHVLAVGV